MKAVILDAYTTNPGDLSWDWLSEFVDSYEVYDRTAPADVDARTKDCEIVITNKTRLMPPQLDALTNTRYIGLLSTGYDAVDVAYARRLGIPVCNIPAYSTGGVAQLTFSLLLEFTNRVALHNAAVKAGEWQKNGNFCFWKSDLREVGGKTFGIVGYGRIGHAVADIARAFGMRVLCCTAHPDKYPGAPVTFVSLAELLRESDFVTLFEDLKKVIAFHFQNQDIVPRDDVSTSRLAVDKRHFSESGAFFHNGYDISADNDFDFAFNYHEKLFSEVAFVNDILPFFKIFLFEKCGYIGKNFTGDVVKKLDIFECKHPFYSCQHLSSYASGCKTEREYSQRYLSVSFKR